MVVGRSALIPPPERTEVHLWIAKTGCGKPRVPSEFLLADPLDAERYEQLNQMDSPHVSRFLWGRALIRLPLAAYTGLNPDHFLLTRGRYGQLKIRESRGCLFHFNLSHARTLSVCAFSSGVPIGVDLEELSRAVDLEAVARVFLTTAEIDGMRLLPAGMRRRQSLLHWSLKEAYLKARGIGLVCPPKNISFHQLPDCLFALSPSRQKARFSWGFHASWLTPVHTLAVALRGGQPRVRLFFIDDLLATYQQDR